MQREEGGEGMKGGNMERANIIIFLIFKNNKNNINPTNYVQDVLNLSSLRRGELNWSNF